MGIRLIVEALDHAPATLTPRERYALLVLAEDARDETRICSHGVESNEKVMRRFRAGRSERAAIINALIAKGAIERVQRGQMYRHAVFRIRPLASDAQHPGSPDSELDSSVRETQTLDPGNPDAGDSQGPDFAVPGSGNSPPSIRETRTPSPQSPQDSSSLSRPERRIMAATGATLEETREIISIIQSENPVRKLGPYIDRMAENEDLPELLDRVRAAASRRAAPPLPPKCSDPDCGPDRRIEDDDGQIAPCPRCHPTVLERAAS